MRFLERLLIKLGVRSIYSGGDGSSRGEAIVINAGPLKAAGCGCRVPPGATWR